MYRVTRQKSTKAERIVYELLKELHLPFKHRWIVNGREIDFIVGNFAIEIDGHEQDGLKNEELARLGYVPIHFNNQEILNDRESIKVILKNIWQQIFQTESQVSEQCFQSHQ